MNNAKTALQVSFATFGVYVLTGNELTAAKAFVAMSLFNIIRLPFTLLPQCVFSFVQVSLKFPFQKTLFKRKLFDKVYFLVFNKDS